MSFLSRTYASHIETQRRTLNTDEQIEKMKASLFQSYKKGISIANSSLQATKQSSPSTKYTKKYTSTRTIEPIYSNSNLSTSIQRSSTQKPKETYSRPSYLTNYNEPPAPIRPSSFLYKLQYTSYTEKIKRELGLQQKMANEEQEKPATIESSQPTSNKEEIEPEKAADSLPEQSITESSTNEKPKSVLKANENNEKKQIELQVTFAEKPIESSSECEEEDILDVDIDALVARYLKDGVPGLNKGEEEEDIFAPKTLQSSPEESIEELRKKFREDLTSTEEESADESCKDESEEEVFLGEEEDKPSISIEELRKKYRRDIIEEESSSESDDDKPSISIEELRRKYRKDLVDKVEDSDSQEGSSALSYDEDDREEKEISIPKRPDFSDLDEAAKKLDKKIEKEMDEEYSEYEEEEEKEDDLILRVTGTLVDDYIIPPSIMSIQAEFQNENGK